MELSGTIIAILEQRSGISKTSGKEWNIAQYVLETIEAYPKRMVFELFGKEKIDAMAIQQGESLTVSFDVDAREYNGRWYNQFRAWKIERNAAVKSDEKTQSEITAIEPFEFNENDNAAEEELPF